jgi:hypothetical protein
LIYKIGKMKLIIITILLILIDTISTFLGISKYGIVFELNPVIKYFYQNYNFAYILHFLYSLSLTLIIYSICYTLKKLYPKIHWFIPYYIFLVALFLIQINNFVIIYG